MAELGDQLGTGVNYKTPSIPEDTGSVAGSPQEIDRPTRPIRQDQDHNSEQLSCTDEIGGLSPRRQQSEAAKVRSKVRGTNSPGWKQVKRAMELGSNLGSVSVTTMQQMVIGVAGSVRDIQAQMLVMTQHMSFLQLQQGVQIGQNQHIPPAPVIVNVHNAANANSEAGNIAPNQQVIRQDNYMFEVPCSLALANMGAAFREQNLIGLIQWIAWICIRVVAVQSTHVRWRLVCAASCTFIVVFFAAISKTEEWFRDVNQNPSNRRHRAYMFFFIEMGLLGWHTLNIGYAISQNDPEHAVSPRSNMFVNFTIPDNFPIIGGMFVFQLWQSLAYTIYGNKYEVYNVGATLRRYEIELKSLRDRLAQNDTLINEFNGAMPGLIKAAAEADQQRSVAAAVFKQVEDDFEAEQRTNATLRKTIEQKDAEINRILTIDKDIGAVVKEQRMLVNIIISQMNDYRRRGLLEQSDQLQVLLQTVYAASPESWGLGSFENSVVYWDGAIKQD